MGSTTIHPILSSLKLWSLSQTSRPDQFLETYYHLDSIRFSANSLVSELIILFYEVINAIRRGAKLRAGECRISFC